MDRKWWTLVAVCVATFMLLLDITIVNVALPDIADATCTRQLHRPAVGDRRLRADARRAAADRRLAGRPARPPARLRRSAWSSSPSASLLLRARRPRRRSSTSRARLQGIGGAIDVRHVAGAARRTRSSGPERGTAFGVWGATIGGAVAIGPLVGGVARPTRSAGSAIFFVNVPIGIAAIALDAAPGRRVAQPAPAARSTGSGP